MAYATRVLCYWVVLCVGCVLPEVKLSGARDAAVPTATKFNATPAIGSGTHASSTAAVEPTAASPSEDVGPPTAKGGSSSIDAGPPAVASSSMDSSVAALASDAAQQACATPCGTECPDLMSDARHCGSCDIACARTCLGGECQPRPIQLVAWTGSIDRLVLGKDALYWSDHDTRAVMKAALADGSVKTLVVTDTSNLVYGVDAHDVYYLASDGVRSVPIDGGEPKLVVQPDAGLPTGFSMDSQWLYLSSPNIYRAPHGSSAFTLMLSDQKAFVIEAYEGAVYYQHLDNSVWKITAPGGTPIQLQAPPPSILSHTVDSHYLYLLFDLKIVRKVDVNTGVWSDLAQTHESQVPLVSDGTHLYWSRPQFGVQRIPIEGGDVVTMATGHQTPFALAVDESNVYWNNSDGGIMKTPK